MTENSPENCEHLPDDAYKLGVDQEGTEYYHALREHAIYLFVGGELTLVEELGNHNLGWYVNRVEGEVGWEEVNYDDRSMDEWLAECFEKLFRGEEVA